MKTNWIMVLLAASVTVSGCKEKPATGEARDSEVKASEPAPPQIIAVHRDPAPQARLTEKSQILAADPAFTSLSDNETDWLKRNGFLTHEELRDLQGLGDRALLARSRDKGDMAAATALGILRLRNGDTRGAIRSLDRAARSGSLYALEQLAYAELLDFQNTPGQRDIASEQNAQAQFVARMEQARIMGDHRVDFYIKQVASGLDRQRYGDQILRQTTEYIRQMGSDAATRGVQARGPDARPNNDLWQALSIDRSGFISASSR